MFQIAKNHWLSQPAVTLMSVLLPLALILSLGPALSCTGSDQSHGGVNAWVSILPQAGFVQAIGGDRVHVQALVRPGESPETYQPTPRQLAEISSADVYFRIGVPFETVMLPKIASMLKDLSIVDTRAGIRLRPMSEPHAHGETASNVLDAHDENAMDPHIWLDPSNNIIMAATIRDALIRLDPAGKSLYEANTLRLIADLEQLDRDLHEKLAPLKGREIFVYHPSFGYFTDAYGLRQVAIEAGGREPGPRGLADLIDLARQHQVHVIFVQPQFDQKNAETIATAIDGVVVKLDPLAPDILANLRAMAETISIQYQQIGPD